MLENSHLKTMWLIIHIRFSNWNSDCETIWEWFTKCICIDLESEVCYRLLLKLMHFAHFTSFTSRWNDFNQRKFLLYDWWTNIDVLSGNINQSLVQTFLAFTVGNWIKFLQQMLWLFQVVDITECLINFAKPHKQNELILGGSRLPRMWQN